MDEIILVTGAAGYIGSVLTRLLLNDGYKVRGVDCLKFGNDSLSEIELNHNYEFIQGDIRDEYLLNEITSNVYGVIHLAAIVGDPACAKEPDLAVETNWTAAKNLFDLCKLKTSIKKFIFASTCSNYGKMDGEEYLNEYSALKPVSLYAELKVKFEKYLLESSCRNDLMPTALRFATVYGISPRMRFDLTVNEFIRDANLNKELVIYGEKFWRPYCHINDLARACKLVLENNDSIADHNIFGVGDTRENYQKEMIANEIKTIIPDVKVTYVHREEDPRNYKVEFSKIKKCLNFHITKMLPDGLKEVNSAIDKKCFADPFSKKYMNVS